MLAMWDGHSQGGARQKLSFAVMHLGGFRTDRMFLCTSRAGGFNLLAVTLTAIVLAAKQNLKCGERASVRRRE